MDTIWQGVLGEIELSISKGNFVTWFRNTELIECSDDNIVIGVPNVFIKQQLESKFDTLIRSVIRKSGLNPSLVNYQVKTSRPKTASTNPGISLSSARHSRSAETPATSSEPSILRGGLNPRYVFSNFIVGSSNDLAYTASQTVAENPGEKYNPLYLYGGVGLGKTHLVQAIGNYILNKNPSKNIIYITTETFIKEFTDAIRYKKKVSDKYRKADVLIVDDMQFIAGKEKTQEEFFHTFNTLHQANKQIIISSDKPPRSIPTLTDRLRSRFEWGMAIDIQMPDFETRLAIVSAKSEAAGINLSSETIEYLASNIKSNIRELEGALNQLLAYAEMRGVLPDVATAEGLLGGISRSRPQHLSAKKIIDNTARHFQLETKEICGPKRDKHIVVPRQIAMYLLRSELHLSFPRIANELGRKDHTTAIHSVEKIEKAIKLDFMIREQVADIRDRLYV